MSRNIPKTFVYQPLFQESPLAHPPSTRCSTIFTSPVSLIPHQPPALHQTSHRPRFFPLLTPDRQHPFFDMTVSLFAPVFPPSTLAAATSVFQLREGRIWSIAAGPDPSGEHLTRVRRSRGSLPFCANTFLIGSVAASRFSHFSGRESWKIACKVGRRLIAAGGCHPRFQPLGEVRALFEH